MERSLATTVGLMAVGLTLGQAQWAPAKAPLMTRWASKVSPTNALPDYPRPQMVRKTWKSLNGLWDYTVDSTSGKILVPFAYESALSGVGKALEEGKTLHYKRDFTAPKSWKKERVLLHFGAVNWDSEVRLNGELLGSHRGGYDPFTFDVTEAIKAGENQLEVSVRNPVASDVADAQVLGKQRRHPEGIFYTAATGIWQSVWLEPVPKVSVDSLRINPELDAQRVLVTANTSGSAEVKVTAFEGDTEIATATGKPGAAIALSIPSPHAWTPSDPHLYSLKVSTGSDTVSSYFAMRKVSLGKDEQGRLRIFLNNHFLFQVGLLDQGYWPDGIYTAPTDAALKYDIQAAKKLGFNLLRKHAKVEPDRWYYWADKLGMLVWQDMPQAFSGKDGLSAEASKQWDIEWEREIAWLYNHPSIIVWTPFNEGWGQHDTPRIVEMTRKLDPTRLVNNASGWNDMNVGDIHDTHHYPEPESNVPSATRASVCGEFGGLGMAVQGHMWTEKAWGYQGVYTESAKLTEHFQRLFREVYKLRDEKGMSAVVYTQITDVEQESNGLLTYDRAVIKLDPKVGADSAKGIFPPTKR